MKWIVVLYFIAVTFMPALCATIAVVNPEKPDMLSDGEVGVMLDIIGQEADKSDVFNLLPTQSLQSKLLENNKSRVGLCPDMTCIKDIGSLIGVQFLILLSIKQEGPVYKVLLSMYDIASGKKVAEFPGNFNGPKSQIVLKFLPRQTKELMRIAEPVAKKYGKVAMTPQVNTHTAPAEQPQKNVTAKPVTAAKAVEAPEKKVSTVKSEPVAVKTTSQSTPAVKDKKRKFLHSPAFWMPTVTVLVVPVAIILYVRQNREASASNDEMPIPEYPGRPVAK